MNKQVLFFVALALCGGAQADSFVTRARVIESTPIVETVYEPVEICRYETRPAKRSSSMQDKIIGGVLGGAAGSAVGKGRGRDAAAGVGALIGSEIGDGNGGITEGELIGGIAGGIIGNQIGSGSGRTAATGAGALIGAIVGDRLQNGNSKTTRASKKQRVCEQEDRPKKVITGYNITYEYRGMRSEGYLPYRPGEFVDVSVDVSLVEDRTSATQ